ncbi:uncharacterized protein [Heterodontus francisci]|uniref:uncharacterized protein isoform X3 n=1 Tax=Heterodontus francisci TaxID=7792 RepID=UPI00355B352D
MKCLILGVFVFLRVLNSAATEDGSGVDSTELALSNGSSLVLLPCSGSLPRGIKEIQWTFEPASGNNRTRLCTIDNGNDQCNSTTYSHIKLAEPKGFTMRNYSLYFNATMEYAGHYNCFLYPEDVNQRMEIRLIVIIVSVSPAGAIPLESSVFLTCEISDLSYFNSIDWSTDNNVITGKEIEIQWKLNKQLIHQDQRRKFDFRSLNISNFQRGDAGRYTYTVRYKNGKSFCSYNSLLEISELTPTYVITGNSPTGTSVPPENMKRNIAITGAVVGVTVLALAMVLIGLLIKSKYKLSDQNSAQINEESYATINLDALGKAGKNVKRSEETVLYAEIKTN